MDAIPPTVQQCSTKALKLFLEELEVVNQKYGVGAKKLTSERWARLKREACYNTAPKALAGLAMCAMAVQDVELAQEYADRIRKEFPLAALDMRNVEEALVLVELLILSKYDVDRNNYLSLMKYDELTTDPVVFYQQRLKLVVAHFIEQAHGRVIEGCLKMIRAEPKLLLVLRDAGIISDDVRTLGPRSVTPAHKATLCIFEALGTTSEYTIKGRRLLQLYL